MAGNMTFAPRAGDEGTPAKAQFYVYDAWNRMTGAYEDDADGTSEPSSDDTKLPAYAYDGMHRRISGEVDPAGRWATMTSFGV